MSIREPMTWPARARATSARDIGVPDGLALVRTLTEPR